MRDAVVTDVEQRLALVALGNRLQIEDDSQRTCARLNGERRALLMTLAAGELDAGDHAR